MLSKITKLLFQTYFRLKRPMTLGVRIIALDNEKRICLIRHTYVKGLHLPGGGVEPKETIFEAAAKELLEETGIAKNPEEFKLIGFYSNEPNFKSDHIALLKVENCTAIENFKTHEISQCMFIDINSVPPDATRATIARLKEFEEGQFTNRFW